MNRTLIAFLFSLSFVPCAMADNLIVIRPKAKIYSHPTKTAKIVTRLSRGRRLRAFSEKKDEFFRLVTKSKRPLWIHQSDVRLEREDLNDDLVTPESPKKPKALAESPEPESRLHLDLGFSTGSQNDVSYGEANIGLSYYFLDWLAWRNSVFYRFVNKSDDDVQVDDAYGLDSSLRGIFRAPLGSSSGATLFGGPGVRFPSEGQSTPFAEAGLVLKIFGFSIGGGAKVMFTKMVDDEALENDTQYFIVLSGSASL